MKILVRGRDVHIAEFHSKFEDSEGMEFDKNDNRIIDFSAFDVVIDFLLDESPENLELYAEVEGLTVFCNSVKSSLAEFSFYLDHRFKFKMIGFNGMPAFIDRDLLEITLLNKNDGKVVEKVCSELGTDFIIVDDRVGMVSPRVICMIINEAYFTMQEGTADKKSIDLAMTLGTNYPYGPFEWANRIGITNVYELLESIYEDTKDERYKICPALKREYMLQNQ